MDKKFLGSEKPLHMPLGGLYAFNYDTKVVNYP